MAKSSDSLIMEARDAFDAAVDVERENLLEAEKDLKFLAGEQWDEEDKRQRIRTGRPALTINRLPQYIRQVTGDIRLNPPGVVVRPVDGGADPKMAKTFNGLIRNIESASNAKGAYVQAAENAVRCGQGFFRVTYDYASDGSFDMELGIGRLASPFAAMFYAGTVDPTGADAEGCFVQELIPVAEFERRFPKAALTSWDDQTTWGEWKQGEYIRLAEWWRRVPVKKTLLLLRTGMVIDATDREEWARAAAEQAGGVLRERVADSYKVEMRLINGVEQLEETAEWPSCYLPIIRVVGEEINVGERLVRAGVVRFARDAQVLFNVQRSALAEAVAMAPKAKWVGTTKQFAGHLDKWRNANQLNLPYLPYTPDEKAPGPPQRISPEMPAQALLQDVAMAAQDIEATIGIYRESLGRESNAQSGKAIISRQREGDVGTFLYMDNLAEAVCQAGRCLVDMIPRVYDTQRSVRILGEDGSEDFVQINVTDQMTGQRINDLSVGRYDVIPSVGPAFSTRREEARESMMAFFQAQPQSAAMMGDLFAKSMDWPGADEFASRMRRMAMMQGLIEPDPSNEEDAKIMQGLAQQQQKPDANMMLAQAEMGKAQAQQMKAQADAQMKAQELEVEKARLMLEAQKVQLEAQKLELERQRVQAQAMTSAADTESKIAERDTNTKIASVEAMQAMVESVMDRRMAQMQAQQSAQPQIVVVGRGGEDDDAKQATMEAVMQQMTQAMNRPKRIVRGPDGRAVGVE